LLFKHVFDLELMGLTNSIVAVLLVLED
jgi:hypothetical protein